MLAINTDSISQQYLTSHKHCEFQFLIPNELNELRLYLHVLLLINKNIILFLENTLSRYTEQN